MMFFLWQVPPLRYEAAGNGVKLERLSPQEVKQMEPEAPGKGWSVKILWMKRHGCDWQQKMMKQIVLKFSDLSDFRWNLAQMFKL